jgi:lipopolysaccharide/colanic/teichoic acid biosynthesis glycosyltransferase
MARAEHGTLPPGALEHHGAEVPEGSLPASKRLMDLVLSSVALVVLAPFLLLVAVLIKLDSPGPVFFRQARVGARDRRFWIYKFRTMALGADEQKREFEHLNTHALNGGDPRLFKIVGDPRVTRVGRFLRRYFLDEVPQLINVLKGDMSLVGPRPLIPEEDRYVEGWTRRRLQMRPGMTGLWQVLGHSAIPFEQMVTLDCAYVATWSLRGDVRLLLRTIPVVLSGGGRSY